jgi:putative tryptophan/tyrosine transport system substrate-binding protein
MTSNALRSGGLLRRTLVAAALALLVSCSPRSETPEERPRVVIYTLLSYPILDQSIDGIKESLERNGYSGDAIELVELNAGGQFQMVDGMAREALASDPDIIIPVSTPVAQAVARAADADQSIVFSTVTNPADIGFDASNRNMTGVSDAVNYQANIDLIRMLFPQARRIGVVYNASERNSQFGVDQIRRATDAAGLTLVTVNASTSAEAVSAVRSLQGRADVLYVGSDNTVAGAIDGVVAAAADIRLPVIASDVGSVEQGALAAVSVDYERLGERVGDIVVDILRNDRRASEIEPVSFVGDRLVINAATARRMNYSFPQSVMQRDPHVVQASQ